MLAGELIEYLKKFNDCCLVLFIVFKEDEPHRLRRV
jgi:hypothetical protein